MGAVARAVSEKMGGTSPSRSSVKTRKISGLKYSDMAVFIPGSGKSLSLRHLGGADVAIFIQQITAKWYLLIKVCVAPGSSTSGRKIACNCVTVELWSRDTLSRPQWLEINGRQQAEQVYRGR